MKKGRIKKVEIMERTEIRRGKEVADTRDDRKENVNK